jgi:hypothetical protein
VCHARVFSRLRLFKEGKHGSVARTSGSPEITVLAL